MNLMSTHQFDLSIQGCSGSTSNRCWTNLRTHQHRPWGSNRRADRLTPSLQSQGTYAEQNSHYLPTR